MRTSSKSRQQEIAFPNRHGGRRTGAGRKPKPGKQRMPHAARPSVKPRWPVHVTVRMKKNVPRLRNFELVKVLRQAFVKGCKKDGFRICQFSIQANHIHLICEAADQWWLARGVQGWSVRVARGVNRQLGRKGSVLDDRYHVEVITTPRQMRNALCYVLQNARRHDEYIDRRFHGIDPFSSAWWFDGWSDQYWRKGLVLEDPEPPVAMGQSWLLNVGWRRHRLIDLAEVPGSR